MKRQGEPIGRVIGPVVAEQRGRLTRMSLAAILGGFAEAATLVLIARIAFALTAPEKPVRVTIGPFGSFSFPVESLIACAAVLVVARMALQATYTVLANRTTVDVVESMRVSLLRRFLAAGWALQASQREGRLQELLTTYTNASAQAVASFGQIIISGFNLAALLITAVSIK